MYGDVRSESEYLDPGLINSGEVYLLDASILKITTH